MDLNIQAIRKVTKECKTFLTKICDIRAEYCDKSSVEWFHALCNIHIKRLLQEIQVLKCNEEVWNKLLLLCTQLLTLLSLFVRIFKQEFTIKRSINEGREFLAKNIKWCLDHIDQTITQTTTNSQLCNGQFLTLIDVSIEKFSHHPSNSQLNGFKEEVKQLLDEIFTYAISVAHISCPEDVEMMKGGSHSLIEAFNSYIKELECRRPNYAMAKMFRDNCVQKLCSLESKVNATVLNLSLQVFGQYQESLDKMYDLCMKNNNNIDTKQLDELVDTFDTIVERIFQIGLFAISCSTSREYCTKIQNYLASLELLETELVPCIRSKNEPYASILKSFWLEQVEALKKEIFCIIDPFAFCQVVYEKCEAEMRLMSKFRIEGCFVDFLEPLTNLIHYGAVLEFFIRTVLENQLDGTLSPLSTKLYFDYQIVLNEIVMAKRCLFNTNFSNGTAEHTDRVYKRCKIILPIIKKVWTCFNTETATSLKADRSVINSESFVCKTAKQSETLLKNRSILYREASVQKPSIIKTDGTNLLKHLHLRNLQFNQSMRPQQNELTMALQISNMLSDLTKINIKI